MSFNSKIISDDAVLKLKEQVNTAKKLAKEYNIYKSRAEQLALDVKMAAASGLLEKHQSLQKELEGLEHLVEKTYSELKSANEPYTNHSKEYKAEMEKQEQQGKLFIGLSCLGSAFGVGFTVMGAASVEPNGILNETGVGYMLFSLVPFATGIYWWLKARACDKNRDEAQRIQIMMTKEEYAAWKKGISDNADERIAKEYKDREMLAKEIAYQTRKEFER
jgi:hypothetical protein